MLLSILNQQKFLIQNIPTSYSLSVDSRTSAGVYTSDGTLIKRLFNGVQRSAGTYTPTWDGTNDDGSSAPSGNYNIKVLSNNVTYDWEGVVGNTSTETHGSTVFHSLLRIYDMTITGSNAYFCTFYDEATSTSFKFNTSTPGVKTQILSKGAEIRYVATDGTNVYWAGEDPNLLAKTFVFATKVSDDTEYTFSSGSSYQTVYGRNYISVVDYMNNVSSTITGFAVQKTNNFMFVSRAALNEIHVINKSTGALVQTITSITAPKSLTIDGSDNLWVVSGTNTIAKYSVNSSTGVLTSLSLSLSGLADPVGISINYAGNTVVVNDGGSQQRVRFFDNTTGTEGTPFGQLGGYTVSATAANDKFYFKDNRGNKFAFVEYQSDGSFWVSDPGTERVQHFNSDRSYRDNIMYMSASFDARADKANPNRVFSDFLEFSIDYTKPLSPTNGSWTLVNNWAGNVPTDYSTQYYRFKSIATLSNGRTYAHLWKESSHAYEIVELVANGLIRYTGIVLSDENSLLYADGSLRSQTTFNNFSGIPQEVFWTKRDLTGFDGSNNPIWATATTVVTIPAATNDDPMYDLNPAHLRPGEVTSSNLVIAFDGDTRGGYHLGAIKVGDNKWLWRAAPSTDPSYTGDFPTNGDYDIGNSVNNAGSAAYVKDRSIFWGYVGEFWKASQTNKWNHFYDNGLFVGQFGVVRSDGGGEEAPPMMASNAIAGEIVKVGSDYYIYHCDEGQHGGVHRWKISGLNTIQEFVIPVTK